MVAEIQFLMTENFESVISLARNFFATSIAPRCSAEEVRYYENLLKNYKAIGLMQIRTATVRGRLAGMIATSCKDRKIDIFFVFEEFRHNGIGLQLLSAVVKNTWKNPITMDVPSCAVNDFQRLGFHPVDKASPVGTRCLTLMRRDATRDATYFRRLLAYRLGCLSVISVLLIFTSPFVFIIKKDLDMSARMNKNTVSAKVVATIIDPETEKLHVIVEYNKQQYIVQDIKEIQNYKLSYNYHFVPKDGQLYEPPRDQLYIHYDTDDYILIILTGIISVASIVFIISYSVIHQELKWTKVF